MSAGGSGTDKTNSNLGLYRPEANLTFGEVIRGVEIIFQSIKVGAECGTPTVYNINFNYDGIKSGSNSDSDSFLEDSGCQMVDGVCVLPSFETPYIFELKEFTDSSYTTLADENTKKQAAGQRIYLSLRKIPDPNYKLTRSGSALPKVALTKCDMVTSEGVTLTLMEPGGKTDSATCSLDAIGLQGNYDDEGNFNFSHTLFLLGGGLSSTKSSLNLMMVCTVELCDKKEANSSCNKAAVTCMGDAKEKKNEYLCDGLCNDNQICEVDNDSPVCN